MSNTNYYAAELMIYFEKTQLLEVIRVLIIRLGMDRPYCVKHYIRKNLRKIACSVMNKNIIVHLPVKFDVEKFAKTCLQMYKIPIIAYNTGGHPVDAIRLNEILKKFEKFCRKNGIHKKHRIYLNFPKNFDEILGVENCQSPPTNFIHVNAGEDVEPDFKDVLDFYACNRKEVLAVCVDEKKSIEETVVPEVMYKIKFDPKPPHSFNIGANFVHRVVMIGRRGTGRKTQAKMLAARFNLVMIDIESLIQQSLTANDNMSKVLCISYKKENKFSSSAIIPLLWKRLLQKDALAKGWVVIGFPKCVSELKTLVEQFQTPPNGVVVLHCSRNIAMKRLIRKWEGPRCTLRSKVNTTSYVEMMHNRYDQNKKDIYKYLKDCKIKTIHVDGTGSISFIKNKVFALLDR